MNHLVKSWNFELTSLGGYLKDESIGILKEFYERGNEKGKLNH